MAWPELDVSQVDLSLKMQKKKGFFLESFLAYDRIISNPCTFTLIKLHFVFIIFFDDDLILCTGSFLVIELNDFGVLTSWFILKAHTSDIATKWMDHINSAQVKESTAIDYHFTVIVCFSLSGNK